VYSTSAEALARLPSLSLSRRIFIPFRLPSGSIRGTTTQAGPSGASANVKNRSLLGADVNHFRPVTRYVPSAARSARVATARRSEPPCTSVIDMPASSPALPSGVAGPGT
jgi:hypothetical protein